MGGEYCLNPKAIVIPLNNYVKKRATLSIARRKDEVVDEQLMYDLMGTAIENRKSDWIPSTFKPSITLNTPVGIKEQ